MTDKYADFDARAEAGWKSWAALRRDFEALREEHVRLNGDHAVAKARIEELIRANQQLSNELLASQKREGEALRRVGWLEGQMHTAAQSFHEAVNKPSNGAEHAPQGI